MRHKKIIYIIGVLGLMSCNSSNDNNEELSQKRLSPFEKKSQLVY